MWDKKQSFCTKCGKFCDYYIRYKLEYVQIRGTDLFCLLEEAHCSECGNEMYVSVVNDRNEEAIREAYDAYSQ